ncbi:hypothetical protein [Anabaena azotica]|uniref:hypothetical protein n=1 Tax=Anabaena azotica TaxID=197653 RepID=UPI0039A532D2
MKNYELPLLELFTRLRQAGLPLGVNEYQLVLRALQSGFGIPNQEALARLCCTLWVKSPEEKLLFNYHFEQVMAENIQKVIEEDKTALLAPESPITPELALPKNPNISLWGKISLPIRLVLGGTLILVTGISLWSVRSIKECPYFISQPKKFLEERQEYRYEIKVCKANPTDTVEITALQKHPLLTLDDTKKDGTAILKSPNTAINYVVLHSWDLQGHLLKTKVFDDLQNIQNINYSNYYISFSPNGQFVVVTRSDVYDRKSRLWNIQGQPLNIFGNLKNISDISFSPNGQFIVTSLNDGTARLWNIQGKPLNIFGNLKIRNIRFSPKGQFIVTSLNDGTARLWNIQGKPLNIFGNLKIRDIRFSPNGQFIVTRLNDGTARLWNIQGQILSNFGNLKNISYISFSPNGQFIVTKLDDGTARLWNIQGQILSNFGNLKIRNISVSSNEQFIVTTLDDGTARLWNIQGQILSNFDNLKIWNISVNPKGQFIVTRLNDGTARLWNIQGQILSNFDNLKNISDISFSPNGQFIVTQLDDWYGGTAQLWNIQGQPLNIFGNIKNISDISFSPNGQFITTVSISSEVKLQVTNKTTKKSDTQTFSLISRKDSSAFQKTLIEFLIMFGFISGSLVALVLPGGYIIVRLMSQRNAKPPHFPVIPQRDEELPTSIAAVNQEIKDEVQVAQAIHQGTRSNGNLPLSVFTESNEYFPVTSRQMKQSWRYLRRFIREGPPIELDVEATVQQMSRQGMLLHPVFQPRRVNRNELLLLVDQDGSMAPFHSLSERLANTAIQGGRLNKASIYYFHNCPHQYLYHDPYHQVAEPISQVLTKLRPEYAGILIFSDAGAARGAFNRERLDLTAEFLDLLRQKFRYIAWLNPLPRDRWTGTAGEIAKIVPMFELSRQGLTQAIDVLRGKSTTQMVEKL